MVKIIRTTVRGGIKGARDRAGKGFERAAVRVGLHLLEASNFYIPVDTNNMRAGGVVRKTGSGWRTVVTVGYVADYAVYVHEDANKAHGDDYNKKYSEEIRLGLTDPWTGRPYHPRRPQEQYKFLQRAYDEELPGMISVILVMVGA